MKVELKLKQDIQVYDLVTTFAVSAPAPGLQRLCTFAQDRGGRIQSSDLEEEFGFETRCGKEPLPKRNHD